MVLRDALSYAVGKGAFVSIAMGNEYEEGNPVEYPAAYAAEIDGVMSVGAVGPSLTRAFYSNTGPHLEISAPGGSEPGRRRERSDLAGDDFRRRLESRHHRLASIRPVRRIGIPGHVDGGAARRRDRGVDHQPGRDQS